MEVIMTEVTLLIGFCAVLFLMLGIGMEIVKAIKAGQEKVANEEIAALVVFHCVATSSGEIYQSEECVIYGRGVDLLNKQINDQKCELAKKYQRPVIVHQIVKL